MYIRPVRGNLLIEPPAKETVSIGGIYIPETSDASTRGLTKGKIIAMAEDVDTRRLGFKTGMTVIFNKFAYTEIKISPEKAGEQERHLLLINQDKIEACLEE